MIQASQTFPSSEGAAKSGRTYIRQARPVRKQIDNGNPQNGGCFETSFASAVFPDLQLLVVASASR